MKRNWDTIRRLLLAVEALPTEGSRVDSDTVPGVDNEAAFAHMRWLIEAGFAAGVCAEPLSGASHGCLLRLTWAGCELLDTIRRDTVWNRIKEQARIKGVELTVDAVKALGAAALVALLGG